MPMNREAQNLNSVLSYFCLFVLLLGLTIKYHYHRKELHEKQQVKSWLNTNGFAEYTDSFIEHGKF